ncbi:hypothetical protein G6F54_011792 [Rhizopus delemar]|nr:hypothetical protein G6F54_011792 [Rhizopus delemar]
MATITIKNKDDETIVGILETKSNENKKLVLLVHGEQGHKNGLYQELLAQQIPYNSFRFDLHGHGDSEGQPSYNQIVKNTNDIHIIARYFESLGYEIYAVIAFDRGSLSGLKYATTCDKPLTHYINISTPFYTKDKSLLSEEDRLSLEKNGYFIWKVYQKGQFNPIQVTQKEYEAYTSWDNSHVLRMPKTTCVLTIHGINDQIVPAYHAAIFANKISNHTLMLLPDVDHHYSGYHQELVDIIKKYFEKHENDAYRKAILMGQHNSLVIPRWIDVEGVKNFRDIGGWPIKDGNGYIRERIVFRCGHLVDITPKGIEVLKRLNVIAAFDFRSEPEIERQGVMPPIDGLTHYPSAMFTKADYSPEALATRWKGYFEGPYGFPKNHSTTSTKSIIVHCTAGKDRTGIFGMLLLGLCGVDDEIIANEYALSNLGYWEHNN